MTILNSLFLGALQGATEFLPVSSSGHLLVLQHLLGLGEVPLLYDVLLHVATLAVVVIVFRGRIGAVFVSLWRWISRTRGPEDRENLRLALAVVLATIVTAVVGLGVSRLEPRFQAQPRLVAAAFLVTALILLATLARRGGRGYLEFGLLAACVVGFAQGIGAVPGISRSGITISAALLLGMRREKAGEFSFLIAIPAILGALVLQLRDAGSLAEHVHPGALAAGLLAAFGVGLGALLLLLSLVRQGRLALFAAYLVPAAAVTFLLL